ncbi:MAG: VCBS repeat-containing protein, partial [Varibaculum cambriense]|nr:VCBS repeat-containing protein [Varibaculum cambriense]
MRFGQPRQIGNGWGKDGVLAMNDYTGNHRADLFYFLEKENNVIFRLYEGTSGGGLRTIGDIGQGWGAFDSITSGDVNRDGKTDLIARKNNGDLYLYLACRSSHCFNSGVKIGNGWSGMRSLTFMSRTVGNKTGILAVDRAGQMHVYPFLDGRGRFDAPVRLGFGWNNITRVMSTGDVDQNGKSDFLATDSAGYLYLYRASSGGTAFSSGLVGNGWNVMSQIMPIDISLGGGIMAIDHKGLLHRYPLRGSSSAVDWRPPARYLQPVSAIRAPGTTVVPRRGWNGTKVREVRARLGVGVPLNSGMT